ncbi:MAG: hypothetical protein KKE05_05080 [Nanoarchaeota archaeon]|nr:hypothetical protein [Nanoarchaeota archaeon]
MQFKDIILPLGKIGDWLGTATQWVISKISELGINITSLQAQVISLLIVGLAIYFVIKFLTKTRKLIKWGLIVLFVFLIISIIAGMFM